jgi:hypothetical protein
MGRKRTKKKYGREVLRKKEEVGRERIKKENGEKVQRKRRTNGQRKEQKRKWKTRTSTEGQGGKEKGAEQNMDKERKRDMEKRSKLSFPQAKFWCFP